MNLTLDITMIFSETPKAQSLEEILKEMRGKLRKSQVEQREGNGKPLQYSCLEIPLTEEPGGLPFMGSQRVSHG